MHIQSSKHHTWDVPRHPHAGIIMLIRVVCGTLYCLRSSSATISTQVRSEGMAHGRLLRFHFIV